MKRLLSYRVANLQGQGARDYQEDSFAFANALDVTDIREKGLLAVVADGMGGMEGGKTASGCVIKTVLSDFEQMDRNGDLSAQLKKTALHASREVNRLLDGVGGSTIVAGIFYQEMLHFVSIGDSYIWLLRGGELIRLNQEHNRRSEVWLETIRSGSMDPSAGRNNFEAEALTQFVGMDGAGTVDASRHPLRLRDGDALVFCSDGVGGVLTEEETVSCLTGRTADQACLAMDGLIRQRNLSYQDNYTALVIQCGY